MTQAAKLPVIDLSSPDSTATAASIRQACIEYGFLYLVNHGIEEALLAAVFKESRKFFSLPVDDKLKLLRNQHRGYTPMYSEILDPASTPRGDSKETFYIGPLEGEKSNLNQWPSKDISDVLPWWRHVMESYYEKVKMCQKPVMSKSLIRRWHLFAKRENGILSAGKRLISLIALALNLEENYFEKVGALDSPDCFLRLLHYPGVLEHADGEIFGASAHSDYGMLTLLVSDGVPGLQICREKYEQPRVWEDVMHINGAFIVNIGDMLERWTNCLFRSTLHRVMPVGQERYSLAFFFDPNADFVVECLESCCDESNPKRFPPIRCGDYLKERFRLTYGSSD